MNEKKYFSIEEIKRKLEGYCVYQDRCHKEIETKLKEFILIEEARNQIILHLLEHNFLNEERYTKAFVSGKLKIKKWGKRRLTLELKKKNISKTNINQALSEIAEKEYIQIFNELAEKRFNAINEKNKYKKKKKLANYLLYRGWESFLVYDKVNELIK